MQSQGVAADAAAAYFDKIEAFVSAARQRKMADEAIEQELRKQGWRDSIIDIVFKK